MISKVTHDELVSLIVHSYEVKDPIFIWGSTGIGKSDTVRRASMELAQKYGLEYSEEYRVDEPEKCFRLVDMRLSYLDASDTKGIPDLSGDWTVWKPPEFFPRKGSQEGRGYLFFDEMNLAPPSVQSTSYEVVLDRRLTRKPMAEGWNTIAAGNRMSDMARVFEMAAPLRDRFSHYELETPHPDDWIQWAYDHDIFSWIIMFLRFRPELLDTFEENRDAKVFATPRSWEKLSYWLDSVGIDDLEYVRLVSQGKLGQEVASEFVAFLKLEQELDIDEVLRDVDSLDYDSLRANQICALVSALHERFKSEVSYVDSYIKVANRIPSEYGMVMISMLSKQRPHALSFILKNRDEFGELEVFTESYSEILEV